MERWVRVAAAGMALGMAAGPVWAGEGAADAAPQAAAAVAPSAGMRIQWDPAGALAPAAAKSGAQRVLPRPDYGSVRPRVTARGHLEIPATVRMATVARVGADGALHLDCLQHGVAHAPHGVAMRPVAVAGADAPAEVERAPLLQDTGTEGR